MIRIHSQRGAMFGLDARIALAIFGGLSIITGAALFSALSQTTTTALITELDNIGKGYTNFVLDTGVDTTTIADLKTSSLAGWQGPYTSFDDPADHPKYGALSLVEATDAAWTAGVPTAATTGWIWIGLTLVPTDLADKIDLQVDGVADPDEGTIRHTNPSSGTVTLYYKVSATQG